MVWSHGVVTVGELSGWHVPPPPHMREKTGTVPEVGILKNIYIYILN